jgi:hypothetical protein
VVALPNKPPVANAGLNQNLYVGDRLYLDGTKTSDAETESSQLKYEWSRDNRVFFRSRKSTRFGNGILPAGRHLIQLTVTDEFGLKDTDDLVVNVTNPLERFAFAGSDRTVYQGDKVQLGFDNKNSSGTSGVEWREDGVVISTSSIFNYEGTTLGDHTLSWVAIYPDGTEISDDLTVTVTEKLHLLNVNAGVDKHIYLGQTATVNSYNSGTRSVGSSKVSNKWLYNGEVVQDNDNFAFTPDTLGEHTLQLLVENGHGLVGTDEVVVYVHPLPETDLDIKAIAGNDQTIYTGDALYLDTGDSYSLAGTLVSRQWSLDGTIISSGHNSTRFQIPWKTAGVYNLTVTVTDSNGLTDSDDIVVTIIDPDRTISADAGNDVYTYPGVNSATIGFANQSYSLNPSPTFRTEWTKDGNVIRRGYGQSWFNYTINEIGTHEITLRVYDLDGNSDTDTMLVHVLDPTSEIYVDAGLDQFSYLGSEVLLHSYKSFTPHSFTDYEWSLNGNVIGTESYIRYTPESLGENIFTLAATDEYGNTGTDQVKITVVEDDGSVTAEDVPPRITVVGDNPAFVIQGNQYRDRGAIAIDIEDGVITNNIIVENSVNTESLSTYTVTYSVRDLAGNTTTASRTVYETDENGRIPPQAMAGEDIEAELGASITLDGSTSQDVDGDIVSYVWT